MRGFIRQSEEIEKPRRRLVRSVPLNEIGQPSLDAFSEDGGLVVWLDPTPGDCFGLCLAVRHGNTPEDMRAALGEAQATLERAAQACEDLIIGRAR